MSDQEENDPSAITLSDVLNDASLHLQKEGFVALALGVRMARAELGDNEIGEGYMRDMMDCLATAEAAVVVVRGGKDEVDLTELAESVDKVLNWGLEPQERMGNALLHITRTLHQVMFALEQPDGGLQPQLVQNIRMLLVELGYEDMVSQPTGLG